MISTRLPCLVLLAAIAGAHAQTIHFADFSNPSGLVTNGSAMQSGVDLALTDGSANQTGSVWFGAPVVVEFGFDTTFSFRITAQSGGGADGLAFVVQANAAGTAALGGPGSALGYGGLQQLLVVELDTFQNPGLSDSSANEISVHAIGPFAASPDEILALGRTTPAADMSDGQVHLLRVAYVPGTLDVYLDNLGTPVLSVPYDLIAGGMIPATGQTPPGLSLTGSAAFVGFTAATSTLAAQSHQIVSWTLSNSSNLDPCFDGTVGATVGSPQNVLTVGGDAGGVQRTVAVGRFVPFTIDVAQPTTTLAPSPFAIFGQLGTPSPSDLLSTVIGDLCLTPSLLAPSPIRFLLADSYGANPTAVAPATLAPWTLVAPIGLPITLQLTFQGVIADTTAPFGVGITNGLILDVVANPAPAITSVLPLAPSVGDVVTVSGTGFIAGATLTLGGVAVPIASLAPSGLTFVAPAGLACDANLVVSNPDGQTASTTINRSPTILATPFSSGPAAGGNNYVIGGSGFVPGTTVDFGGVPAVVNTIALTAITATVPPGVPGVVTVTVASPGGCIATTTYTYL